MGKKIWSDLSPYSLLQLGMLDEEISALRQMQAELTRDFKVLQEIISYQLTMALIMLAAKLGKLRLCFLCTKKGC